MDPLELLHAVKAFWLAHEEQILPHLFLATIALLGAYVSLHELERHERDD